MQNFCLEGRTYLDADGNIVDETSPDAHELLGVEGDEIPHERAVELGLAKPAKGKSKSKSSSSSSDDEAPAGGGDDAEDN